jgi:hypothetical protein
MICHGILNMYETKYGVDPNENILEIGMIHGFQQVYDVHETTIDLVCFFYSCQ